MSSPEQSASPLLVTAAIIERQGKFLITQRPTHKPHPSMWEFPGGKLEEGESPQQALQRELREELAIEVSVGSIFDVVFHRYDWGPVLILAYHCTWLSGRIEHLEVDAHCWATASAMLSMPMLPADKPLIERLQSLSLTPR
ncbi:MAG TPA: (deoxy)nucleoside triphosphate pyrophosphohydrolase [Geopsychrobacteraceae bacterium]|nr:(deoxy)nucleoside triphosphate pyrophosphohydrolase [Geopsychrobacteraceae bacterium]